MFAFGWWKSIWVFFYFTCHFPWRVCSDDITGGMNFIFTFLILATRLHPCFLFQWRPQTRGTPPLSLPHRLVTGSLTDWTTPPVFLESFSSLTFTLFVAPVSAHLHPVQGHIPPNAAWRPAPTQSRHSSHRSPGVRSREDVWPQQPAALWPMRNDWKSTSAAQHMTKFLFSSSGN